MVWPQLTHHTSKFRPTINALHMYIYTHVGLQSKKSGPRSCQHVYGLDSPLVLSATMKSGLDLGRRGSLDAGNWVHSLSAKLSEEEIGANVWRGNGSTLREHCAMSVGFILDSRSGQNRVSDGLVPEVRARCSQAMCFTTDAPTYVHCL